MSFELNKELGGSSGFLLELQIHVYTLSGVYRKFREANSGRVSLYLYTLIILKYMCSADLAKTLLVTSQLLWIIPALVIFLPHHA